MGRISAGDEEDHVAASGGHLQRSLADDFAELTVEVGVGQEGLRTDESQESLASNQSNSCKVITRAIVFYFSHRKSQFFVRILVFKVKICQNFIC